MKFIKQLLCEHHWCVSTPTFWDKKLQINWCEKCDKLTIIK